MSWTIPFRTTGDDDLRVFIYGSNTEDVTLTGAAQPFVVDMDDDDDLFAPVRTSSGNISLVASWDTVKQIVTDGTPKSRLVSLLTGTGTGTTVLWQGYVRCESFDFDYSPFPQEFQIPIVSKLGILDCLHMTKTLGQTSITAFIQEMGTWDNVIFPEINGTLDMYLINRANYLDERDYPDADGSMYESSTYMDILTDICNYMGWQVQEVGNDLYFLSNDNTTRYKKYTWSGFCNQSAGSYTYLDRQQIDLPSFVSDENSASVVPGKNEIKVTGSVNEYDSEIYTFNPESDLEYAGSNDMYAISDDETYQTRVFKSQLGTQIKAYQWRKQPNETMTLNNFKFSNCADDQFYGCAIANEVMKGDDYESSYCNRLILRRFLNAQTFCEISPWRSIMANAQGYVKISFSSVKCCSKATDMFEDDFSGIIRAYVKCGNHYYSDTSGWSSSAIPYNFHVKDGQMVTQGHGEWMKEEKGYFIGWGSYTSDLDESTIVIQIVNILTEGGDPYYDYVDVEGLSISVHYDSMKTYGVESVNEYHKDMANGFEDAESVKCSLTYAKQGQIGKGTVTTKPFSAYPEDYLGERMAAYFAKSHAMYKMKVRGRDMLCPVNTIEVAGDECAIIAQSIDPRYEELTLTLLSLS